MRHGRRQLHGERQPRRRPPNRGAVATLCALERGTGKGGGARGALGQGPGRSIGRQGGAAGGQAHARGRSSCILKLFWIAPQRLWPWDKRCVIRGASGERCRARLRQGCGCGGARHEVRARSWRCESRAGWGAAS
eukprot:6290587-Prymnesium_polylepis.2